MRDGDGYAQDCVPAKRVSRWIIYGGGEAKLYAGGVGFVVTVVLSLPLSLFLHGHMAATAHPSLSLSATKNLSRVMPSPSLLSSEATVNVDPNAIAELGVADKDGLR